MYCARMDNIVIYVENKGNSNCGWIKGAMTKIVEQAMRCQ